MDWRIIVPPLAGTVTSVVRRETAMVGTRGIIARSMVLLTVAPNIVVVAVLVGPYTIGDALFSRLLKDGLTTHAASSDRAGIVAGIYFFQTVAAALAPVLLGVALVSGEFWHLFLVMALVPIIYAPILSCVL